LRSPQYSAEGRPDTQPQCVIRPDGTAEHRITSGGDPFLGSYVHPFALVFGDRSRMAREARRLRTIVPLVRVTPGGGDWPAEQSLLTVTPHTAHVTAFRVAGDGLHVVVNDVSCQPGGVVAKGNRPTRPISPAMAWRPRPSSAATAYPAERGACRGRTPVRPGAP